MGNCFSCPERSPSDDDDFDTQEPILVNTAAAKSKEVLEKHAFLSHSRGTSEDDGSDVHEMVSKINSYLNSKGLKTLFEEDKMNIEAIDHARFIVIFATRKYFDPVNYSLDKELVRRYVKRKGLDRVIVVVMEKSLRDNESWEGPLGLQLRGLSFIDLSDSHDLIDNASFQIVETISQDIHNSKMMQDSSSNLKLKKMTRL